LASFLGLLGATSSKMGRFEVIFEHFFAARTGGRAKMSSNFSDQIFGFLSDFTPKTRTDYRELAYFVVKPAGIKKLFICAQTRYDRRKI